MLKIYYFLYTQSTSILAIAAAVSAVVAVDLILLTRSLHYLSCTCSVTQQILTHTNVIYRNAHTHKQTHTSKLQTHTQTHSTLNMYDEDYECANIIYGVFILSFGCILASLKLKSYIWWHTQYYFYPKYKCIPCC